MKSVIAYRYLLVTALILGTACLAVVPSAMGASSTFDITKMSDMSDFDPNTVKQPTGDTIKMGYLQIMSGPAAGNGELYWPMINWVAYDLNKRGGILVDGKRKKIEIITGDIQGKPATTKQEAERLCLEEKVDVLWGTSGSHLCKIIADVAGKYKIPYMNTMSLSNSLMDAKNFNRYTFRTVSNATQWNLAMAYYWAKQPQTKFYILNQDYVYGHDMASEFRKALAKYKPEATIVGEDFHELWLKDFAPFLTKVMAAQPEVLFTADWLPDSDNLLKQARNMGLDLPIANIYATNPDAWKAVGTQGSKNMVVCYGFLAGDTPSTPAMRKVLEAWNRQWHTWKAPFNKLIYKWVDTVTLQALSDTYWMFEVIEKAGTTDPEKIIATWEGYEYHSMQGTRIMRAEDHQAIFPMYVGVSTYPTKEIYPGAVFTEGYAGVSSITTVPVEECTPPIPDGLKNRLKK